MSEPLYPVVELFLSVQGEGDRTGTLNHFIRLAGCNLHCPFCDTEFQTAKEHLSPAEILDRIRAQAPGPGYLRQSIVITGGEPFIHDLFPLVSTLKDAGCFVAVETNGTLLETARAQAVLPLINWVTVSPKTELPEGALMVANEVKYVIPDMEHLVRNRPNLFFQPEWGNKDAVKRCLELMKEYPHSRLSVQMHKYIGVR